MDNSYESITSILRQSLAGSRYDLSRLDQLTPNAEFESFGFDSLDMVEFFLRVQDEFQFTIKREDFPTLVSVASVRDYIEKQASENQASRSAATV